MLGVDVESACHFWNLKNLVDKVVVDEKQQKSKTWLTTWLLQSYPQPRKSYPQDIHRVIHNGEPVETALTLGFLEF
jgi:hypothetical protein